MGSKCLRYTALTISIIGAVNWGLIGFFNLNLVALLFGSMSWISSLSERFSLVEMIATGIVYLKDNRTDTYQPFISGNGKYCRYDVEKGQIVEL